MKVPYSWLQELIDELPPLDRVTEILDGLGLAVEEVTTYPGAAPGTVAVLIEELQPVPDSDHLVAARVSDGGRVWTVVTGAPNARGGMVTAFAPPGTFLPQLGARVEERVMAGVRSEGMLLSPRELGVFDHGGGLSEFPEEVPAGADLASLWPSDSVIELELTANRADAFSILGVSRDIAAKLNVPYRHPAAGVDVGDETLDDGLSVTIEDPACSYFALRRVDGVRVRPSPVWLQRRLASVGVRPRNNVVDVTNYVTFELGQPSHAYDADRLHEGGILVRRALEGEEFTALGGERLRLHAEDLVIATPGPVGSRPVGLAGVIGGADDSVTAKTTSVALEAAHFSPVAIRRTAKRHGLSTDAHYRFERGVDPALPPVAAARVTSLIAETAGGTVHPGLTLAGRAPDRSAIAFRPSRVRFLTDMRVGEDDQRRYLEALGCLVTAIGDDSWEVLPPSWRFDLGIEEDLIEEIARVHGYEHIGATVPAMRFVPPPGDPTHRALREALAGLGFLETIGYVFSSEAELEQAGAPAPRVRLANPQGVERSVLRTAVYPSLLSAAAANRWATSLALFEIGRVFQEAESERLALFATGPWLEAGWQPGRELDFFLFKGLLESLATRHRVRLEMRPCASPQLHPAVAAEVFWNGKPAGFAGRLHPAVSARYGLADCYLAELELPLASGRIHVDEIPRQPHAERDVAVVAPSDITYRRLEELVKGAAGELLETLSPFDIYEGDQIPAGKRSVAIRLRFRHPERALRDEEVDAYMGKVIERLRAEGYAIRDA